MDKQSLTEQDIRTKFISSAIHAAGCDGVRQIREDVQFTRRRVIVSGKLSSPAEAKRRTVSRAARSTCVSPS